VPFTRYHARLAFWETSFGEDWTGTMKAALQARDWRVRWPDYYALCKPRVVALLVFTALVGMLLASPGIVPLGPLLFGMLGIGLSAASAAAINHVVDQRADARMARTRNRPLPTGALDTRQSLLFAFTIGTLGMFFLCAFVNVLTAVLTFVSLIGYAVVYTMYLKRATPQNIVIGGAAGAMPPVLGWTAITGELHANALLLFLIIFVWTPPHFWALAVHRRDDYARADIPMLPVTHGSAFTRLQILFYTLLLSAISLLPYAVGMSGLLYLVAALILNGMFLLHAVRLIRNTDPRQAMRTFYFSITYLMILFAALLTDHYLRILVS
jgi:protoheme IX farnesyltransferase